MTSLQESLCEYEGAHLSTFSTPTTRHLSPPKQIARLQVESDGMFQHSRPNVQVIIIRSRNWWRWSGSSSILLAVNTHTTFFHLCTITCLCSEGTNEPSYTCTSSTKTGLYGQTHTKLGHTNLATKSSNSWMRASFSCSNCLTCSSVLLLVSVSTDGAVCGETYEGKPPPKSWCCLTGNKVDRHTMQAFASCSPLSVSAGGVWMLFCKWLPVSS